MKFEDAPLGLEANIIPACVYDNVSSFGDDISLESTMASSTDMQSLTDCKNVSSFGDDISLESTMASSNYASRLGRLMRGGNVTSVTEDSVNARYAYADA